MIYPALLGVRKQLVQDAERMFSTTLTDFMDYNGYQEEVAYIRAVNGSSLERCRLNYRFLEYILDDWMPWHTNADYSTLEVNRLVETC